ncbi:MAG: PRC-barrel domain-containing protein [Thermodesulfobacteriota bacterium]
MQTGQMHQGSGQGMQASKLMEKEVQGQNQKKLGTVSDLYMSEDGKVEYLIISKGEDLIPIPWDQVQQMGQEEALTVNTDEQKLENAPAFSENDFQQSGWQQEVRGYYGQEQQGHKMKMKEGGEMKME